MSTKKAVKNWKLKMEKPSAPEVVELPPNSPVAWGRGTMVIVTPKIIDTLVNSVPKGRLITIGEMRKKFARDYDTGTTCPLTTGIFLRIVAEAAEVDRQEGKASVTPYWRVVRDTGEMIDKFPGGIEAHAEKLKAEDFEIVITGRKGNKLVVADLEAHLQPL
jgi:hypothetical protein